jgi:hypothetical protein
MSAEIRTVGKDVNTEAEESTVSGSVIKQRFVKTQQTKKI